MQAAFGISAHPCSQGYRACEITVRNLESKDSTPSLRSFESKITRLRITIRRIVLGRAKCPGLTRAYSFLPPLTALSVFGPWTPKTASPSPSPAALSPHTASLTPLTLFLDPLVLDPFLGHPFSGTFGILDRFESPFEALLTSF